MADPLTIAAVGGQVLSTLGGLFGGKKAKGLDLGKLRREAEGNGFNPLTVLRLTGGAGFASQSQPSPLGLLGEGVSSVASILSVSADKDMQNRETEARIAQMGAQTQAISKSASGVVRRAASPLSVPRTNVLPANASDDLVPSKWRGVDIGDIPMQEVRAINGQTYKVRADILERLQIGEGSTMITEDMEALFGEIGGELSGIGEVIGDAVGVGDPWMQTTGEVEKEKFDQEQEIRLRTGVFQTMPPLTSSPTMRREALPNWMDEKFGKMH